MVPPHRWKGHISISSLLPEWDAQWPSAPFGTASSQLQRWEITWPPLRGIYTQQYFLYGDDRPPKYEQVCSAETTYTLNTS